MTIKLIGAEYLDTLNLYEDIIFDAETKEDSKTLLQDLINNCYYGIFDKRKLVGYFCLHDKTESYYLNNIVIFPEHSNKGISKIILNYIKEISIREHKKYIWLHCSIYNDIAIGLYNKCGFKIKGYEYNFYKEKEDALIMEFYI